MRRLFLLLLLVPAAPSAAARDRAEEDYEAARRAYYALKDDAQRRRFRHHWLNVAHRFEAVAKKHPTSGRAPDALFTAAQLLAELSRVSTLDEDLRAAIADYEAIVERHPKDNLADDAALALGQVYLERTGETEKARRILDRALKTLPRGDRRGELNALRDLLPAAPVPPAKGKRVAAKIETSKELAKSHPSAAAKVEAPKDGAPSRPSVAARVDARSEEPGSHTPASAKSRTPREDAEPRVTAAAKPQAPWNEAESRLGGGTKDKKATDEAEPRVAARAKMQPPAEGEHARPPMATSPDGSTVSEGDDNPDSLLEAIARTAKSPRTPKARKETIAAIPPEEATAAESDSASAPGDSSSAPIRPSSPTPEGRLRAVLDAGTSDVTLAEQLGLKVRRVVIDAGHGGHDTGAIGRRGTREKDVTLAVARKVAEILADRGLEVILTRDDDSFVRLEDRTRIANEARGDLFISIHCNAAADRRIRGVETFTLNVASDRYSIRLAARENAQSEKSLSDLQFILADLATRANTEESTRLAQRVQKSLVGALSRQYSDIEDHGTKQALFYVLLGAKMPAILVETSFLSHPAEERRLASRDYQSQLADAIADGVQAFLDDRHRVAQIE